MGLRGRAFRTQLGLGEVKRWTSIVGSVSLKEDRENRIFYSFCPARTYEEQPSGSYEERPQQVPAPLQILTVFQYRWFSFKSYVFYFSITNIILLLPSSWTSQL
jgi:hypothetical protein